MPRSSRPSAAPPSPSRVRARTRRLLLEAAVRLFAGRGIGATALHEIAAEAGVSNGTFYNYFRTREEIIEATAVHLAERLHGDIARSYEAVIDPAERLAIGARNFVLEAMRDPTWAAALLRVWSSSPTMPARAVAPALADLRAGRRRGHLVFRSEAAALDLLGGTVLAAMRTVLERRAGADHASDVVALVLRGLGVAAAEADAIARRPLPPLRAHGEPALRWDSLEAPTRPRARRLRVTASGSRASVGGRRSSSRSRGRS